MVPIRTPQILCLMIFPPNLNGHGGSQRAWRLVEALRPYGSIHFVLIYSDGDPLCTDAPLSELEPLVASVTRVSVKEWRRRKGKIFGFFHPQALDIVKFGSVAAPRFWKGALKKIAVRLPVRDVDLVVASRVTCAAIAQALIDQKLLSAGRKVVDFDDIVSEFRRHEVRQMGASMGFQGRLLGRLDSYLIAREERRIARKWHSVSVCSYEDMNLLSHKIKSAHVVRIPNIVTYSAIPVNDSERPFRCLFVGNLSFKPNVQGLDMFMRTAWPAARKAVSGITLKIVGFKPCEDVIALGEQDGVTVHADVADLRPFYEDCDVVIVPILFGSGTRVKILEAMAYGRVIVSTEAGAKGLDLVDRRHLVMVKTIADFTPALSDLAQDPELRRLIIKEARLFQEQNYGLPALAAAMPRFIEQL